MDEKNNLSLIQNKKLDELMIDLYSSDLQKTFNRDHNTFFTKKGYKLFSINNKIYDFDKNFIKRLKPIKFSNKIFNNNFYSRDLNRDQLTKRNCSHTFYGKPDNKSCDLLKNYLSEISSEIENEVGTPFRIINVRTASANKGHSEGPTEFHLDLGPRFMRKIMIYPKPMNRDNGSFEFYSREGERLIINTNKPQALLFDSSTLRHRGLPPRSSSSRPMIEITIIPNSETILDLVFAGQNARDFKLEDSFLPKYLIDYKRELVKKIEKEDFGKNVPTEKEWLRNFSKNKVKNQSKIYNLIHNQWRLRFKLLFSRVIIQLFAREIIDWRNAAKNLNIGGGFKFIFNSWINLDECNERYINSLVDFSKVKTIPIPSGTIQKVYSSHFLEHVPDEGVHKILGEIQRVLAKNGSFILKIPDYKEVLKAYRRNNIRFLNKILGPFTDTWSNKKVKLNSLNAASFAFAGYWNKSYGNPFQRSGKEKRGLLPYHGPALMNEIELEKLLKSNNPNFIAKELVSEIKKYSDFGGFNHQNAWNKKQCKNLLENYGFKVVTQNKFFIGLRFLSIPTIFEMFSWSQYIWVVPKSIKKL